MTIAKKRRAVAGSSRPKSSARTPAAARSRVAAALDAIAAEPDLRSRMKHHIELVRLEWSTKKKGIGAGFCPVCGARGFSSPNTITAADAARGAGRHKPGCRLQAALDECEAVLSTALGAKKT